LLHKRLPRFDIALSAFPSETLVGLAISHSEIARGCNGLDWGRFGPGLQVERQSPKNGKKTTANNADFALAA
jgi:hypothetical protein